MGPAEQREIESLRERIAELEAKLAKAESRVSAKQMDANEKLTALVHASPLPIVAFNRDGFITLWNPAAERVFGWVEAEVLGKPLPFIPEEKRKEHQSMRERDLSGQGFRSLEVRRRRKDGQPIDIRVSTAATHNEAGEITGIMSVYVDITEEKKAAEEQRRSVQSLQIIERQLLLLVEASGALLSSPKSGDVVRTILELAQKFIAADAFGVWSTDGSDWRMIASNGLSDSYTRIVLGGSLTLPSAPLLIEDVESCVDLPGMRERLPIYRAEGIRALLTVPLWIDAVPTGTMVCYYREPHHFTAAEVRIAGALGNLAASALGTAKLYEREAELRSLAEAAERRSALLAKIGEQLASSLDYEETLRALAKLAVPTFADSCRVEILEPNGALRKLTVRQSDPERIEFAREFDRKFPSSEQTLTRRVIADLKPVLINEVTEETIAAEVSDPERAAMVRALGLKSVICVPMVFRGNAFGALTFATLESGRRYGPHDLELAQEIARRAAVAADNARLFQEVRDSEERFRRLYDANIIGVAFWGPSGQITSANDEFLRISGVPRAGFETKKSVTPPPHWAIDEKVLQECIDFGVSGTYEKEYEHADGSRLTALLAAACLSPTGRSGVAFVLDITDRKRLEQQFRRLADAAIEISAADSVHAISRIVEEQARGLIGARYARADLSLQPREAPGVGLCLPLKDRRGVQFGQVDVAGNASGTFNESEQAILVQLAEMASIAYENTLLNESLRRINEELSRANEDLNQFAYSASHDLQEPLRMIALYTQMLKRNLDPLLDEDGREFMSYTIDGARRMEVLIRDLLEYTHAVNIRALQDTLTDSSAALSAAVSNLKGAIAEAGGDVNARDLPKVRAHEFHLIQLFQNLIGNAIKYRSSSPPRIDVTAERQGLRWLFRVADNGIGIPEQYQQQVFGIFKRLHSARRYPGTGIGLAICQKIVERYGGRIWVESREGGGSVFCFTMPE